jgi:hypothetical protein
MQTTSDESPLPTLVGAPVATSQRRLSPLAGRWLSGFSEDFTKPLLLGYLRRDALVADGQITELERQMADFAQVEGFVMGHVYVEKPESWPAAFEVLIESVNRYEVTAVVLPSLLHFAMRGSPISIKANFERTTGARALVLAP